MNVLIEPFFTCLLASMIWAPIVFLTASRFTKNEPDGLSDKIWPAALVIAALPVLFAPIAAAFGLSLRTPAPLPPMVETVSPAAYVTEIAHTTTTAVQTPSFAQMLDAAALLYFYGFILFLILGAVRMAYFSYRVRYAYDLDEPKLEAGLEHWRQRMGLKHSPRYAFTDAIASVCVHGVFRPVILMPHNLLDRVSMNDAILMGAHEMAHIKRGDTALFSLCAFVKAIFWFNPFMQRIAARANLAAEQAADALVLSRGVNRRDYAHCFVQGLRFAASQGRSAHQLGRELVPSFTPFDKRSRRERLDAILSGTSAAPLVSLPNKIGLVLSISAAGALAFAQAAFAVAPSPAREALPQAPVDGEVSMPFGAKSERLGKKRPSHEGVDIKAKRGTDVLAAGDGKVIDATDRYRGQRAWGNVVVIDHGHGLVTRYAHLDSFDVKKGERVKAGDVIGAVGSTGRSSGPHLHFEVIQDGLAVDPAPVISASPMPAPSPVEAPLPDARSLIKSAPAPVMLAPAPVIAASPEPAVAPEPTVKPFNERLNERLEGRYEDFETRMAETFQDFDGFDGIDEFTVDLGDINLDGLDDLEGFQFVMPDFAGMSDEDIEALRRTQKQAMRDAAEAMKNAKRNFKNMKKERERAAERAERDSERAERDRERSMRDAERAREHAEEERERARERALERIEYEHERAEERREAMEEAAHAREEMLALREEALREAQQDLEEQRAEIKRLRAELKRKEREEKKRD